MSKRTTRARTAQQTLEILDHGAYELPDGTRVPLADALAAACAGTVLYTPDDFAEVFRQRDRLFRERPPFRTTFEVVHESTLHAAGRLAAGSPGGRVAALNFASARHPGGGFLKGSQAQEESLARASGLYACLVRHRGLYDANDRCGSCLYTDHVIYSPDVPVFRDDADALLPRPYLVSIITAPAVNVGALRLREPENLGRVEAVLRARMDKVLSLAVVHGHEDLVLGAWGCGVLANDPECVAGWFAGHLTGDGLYRHAFRRVVFAVLDRTGGQAVIRPFQHWFGGR